MNINELVKTIAGDVSEKETAAILAVATCFIAYQTKAIPLDVSSTLITLIQGAVDLDADELLGNGEKVATAFLAMRAEERKGNKNV